MELVKPGEGKKFDQHRKVDEVRKSVEKSEKSFEEHELAVDWRYEEKRLDDPARERMHYEMWREQQKAAKRQDGTSEFDAWRRKKETWHEARRRAIENRDNIAAERMRKVERDASRPEVPTFKEPSHAALYSKLETGLHDQVADILDITPDVVSELMKNPRLVVQQNAYDLVHLLYRIREPVLAWYEGKTIRLSISFTGKDAIKLRPSESEALTGLEKLTEMRNPTGIRDGQALLRERYYRLRTATEIFFKVVRAAADPKPEGVLRLGKARYKAEEAGEVTKRAEAVRVEIERTMAAHALVRRHWRETLDQPVDAYLDTGAMIYLSAFGSEIAREVANRTAEPSFFRLFDVLCEDSRSYDPEDDGKRLLEKMNDPQKDLPDEIKNFAKLIGKQFPKEKTNASKAIKIVIERTDDLGKALKKYEERLSESNMGGDLRKLSDAARRLAFEIRCIRDLLESIADNFVNQQVLLQPLDALSAYARGRLGDSLLGI